MRLLTIALVSCGAVALACGGTSQDGLFTPMGETGGGSAWASAGGGVAVGGGTSTGGVGSAGVTGGGVTGSGGVLGSGGFTTNGGVSAAGGFLGVAGGLSDAGGTVGGGGVAGSGGTGDGAGGLTGGGAGAASSGGAPEPSADAGPKGAGGAPAAVCPTGEYKPTLTGPYKSITGTKDIGATIDFTVSDTGVVQGTFSGPGGAKATVSGSIDCATGALTAQILNGTYPVGLTTVKFSGTLTGTYDASVGGFTGGTWTITEPANPRNGGTGTW